MIVTIEQYARLAGVSRTTIYTRINKEKTITPIIDNSLGYEVQLIDTDIHPPKGKNKRGRKKYGVL